MTVPGLRHVRTIAGVLVDPVRTIDRSLSAPRPWAVAATLGLALVALGLGTLPRQLALLGAAFPASADPAADLAAQWMRSGLTRLMIADRLIPSPTLLLAGVLVGIAAEPVLVLPRERRPALWALVALGLAPLVVARVGELAISWILPLDAGAPPGAVIELPHRFRTGPALFWTAESPPPAWLERLDGALNLVTAWAVTLWSVGLARLDAGPKLEPWHVALPLICLGGGVLAVWLMAPLALAAVLGGP